MSDNPYQSPQTAAGTTAPLAPYGGLTETMAYYLRGAAPWLRFLGIMGFIGCGVLAVFGLIALIAMPSLVSKMEEMEEMEVWGSLLSTSVGGLYIVLGVIGFFPARFIYCFGERIRSFLRSNSDQELEQAFKYNRAFWKFSGIMTIIYLAIIPVIIVIGIIVGISSSVF
ncbi:MAG: hypothetical protein LBP93_02415 [Treponema sp.]|nr:hypothetical protein [Treponema sp.]